MMSLEEKSEDHQSHLDYFIKYKIRRVDNDLFHTKI